MRRESGRESGREDRSVDRSSTTSEFHARMLIRRFIFSDALLCQSRVQVFFPFFWRCDFTSAISSVFSANARENEIFCATRRLVQSAAERSREKPVEGRDKARHFHERAGDTDRAHGCYDEHEHHHPRGDRRRLRGACLHAAVRALPRRALSPLARVICKFPSARPFPVSPDRPSPALA